MVITRALEEEIRRIVREEIAADELRKTEMEDRHPRPRRFPDAGVIPDPGVLWFGYDPGEGEDTGE